MIRKYKLLLFTLFLSAAVLGAGFGLARFAFAQGSGGLRVTTGPAAMKSTLSLIADTPVSGAGWNTYVGNIDCTLAIRNWKIVAGKCENKGGYVGDIVIPSNAAAVVRRGGKLLIEGYGVFSPTITNPPSPSGRDYNRIDFSGRAGIETEIVVVNGKFEIRGMWHSDFIGNIVFSPSSTTVTPAALNVMSSNPAGTNVSRAQPIVLIFNQSVRQTYNVLQSNIVITDGGAVVDNSNFSFRWLLAGSGIEITYPSMFKANSTVNVKIRRTLKSILGIDLGQDYTFSYQTGTGTTSNSCGDGIFEPSQEDCDDGNPVSGDGCSSVCVVEDDWACNTSSPSVCNSTLSFTLVSLFPHDGTIDTSEDQLITLQFSDKVKESTLTNITISDGEDVTFGSDTSMLPDGSAVQIEADLEKGVEYTVTVPIDVEAEDERNLDKEYTFSFTTVTDGTAPVVTCGDDVKVSTEECDDSNRIDGDGCSSQCTIETGWLCDISPTTSCYISPPVCGNGKVNKKGFTPSPPPYYNPPPPPYYNPKPPAPPAIPPEECDAGDLVNNDGCNNKCEVETGFKCTGQPSICLVTDLEGTVAPAEVTFPSLVTMWDDTESERVIIGNYRFYLPGYELVSSWINNYNSTTKEYSIDTLPLDTLMGVHMFTVRKISGGEIVNAEIGIIDVGRFFEMDVISWIMEIIENPGSTGLGANSIIEEIALFLSLVLAMDL